MHDIGEVNKYTKYICNLVVQKNGLLLRYLKNINMYTIDICKLAVSQNGLALQYVPINMQTNEICKLAVNQNKNASKYVNIKKNFSLFKKFKLSYVFFIVIKFV